MIGIIGFGNMGSAIALGLGRKIFVSDVVRKEIPKGGKVAWLKDNIEIAKRSDIIIIAVKPQDITSVLREISLYVKYKLIISIAAGVTTKRIEDILGKGVRVIRVMPNMPLMVGKAISAICKGRYALEEDLRIAGDIFSKLGEVIEIGEDKIDAVTAISGSGPAYYFLFTYLLQEAGKVIGLDDILSARLAKATFIGAAELVRSSGLNVEGLVKRIASKGGTTEAALKIFDKRRLDEIVKEAVKKAKERAEELNIG